MVTLYKAKKRNIFERVAELVYKDNTATPYARAVLLGFVGGLRSMMPFAMLNRTSELDSTPEEPLEQLLSSPGARVVIDLLASGELVGDKLPLAPSRIKPLPLLGRIGIGALAGLRICRRYQRPLLAGALLGAVAAGAGSYAGYYARTSLTKTTGLPGPLWGLVEDGAALGLGYLAVKDDSHH